MELYFGERLECTGVQYLNLCRQVRGMEATDSCVPMFGVLSCEPDGLMAKWMQLWGDRLKFH